MFSLFLFISILFCRSSKQEIFGLLLAVFNDLDTFSLLMGGLTFIKLYQSRYSRMTPKKLSFSFRSRRVVSIAVSSAVSQIFTQRAKTCLVITLDLIRSTVEASQHFLETCDNIICTYSQRRSLMSNFLQNDKNLNKSKTMKP